jgi:hypothetical protein
MLTHNRSGFDDKQMSYQISVFHAKRAESADRRRESGLATSDEDED